MLQLKFCIGGHFDLNSNLFLKYHNLNLVLLQISIMSLTQVFFGHNFLINLTLSISYCNSNFVYAVILTIFQILQL